MDIIVNVLYGLPVIILVMFASYLVDEKTNKLLSFLVSMFILTFWLTTAYLFGNILR